MPEKIEEFVTENQKRFTDKEILSALYKKISNYPVTDFDKLFRRS